MFRPSLPLRDWVTALSETEAVSVGWVGCVGKAGQAAGPMKLVRLVRPPEARAVGVAAEREPCPRIYRAGESRLRLRLMVGQLRRGLMIYTTGDHSEPSQPSGPNQATAAA